MEKESSYILHELKDKFKKWGLAIYVLKIEYLKTEDDDRRLGDHDWENQRVESF